MTLKKVQINKIVKNQVPTYVRNEFPLVGEFLSAYYKGQEYQGGPIDLINNIDQYIKLSETGNLTKTTSLTARIETNTTDISVENTVGFPDNNGLIKIGDEIISYDSKTDIKFIDCTRGFSGVTSFENPSEPEDLVFSTSVAAAHDEDVVVENLSVLFLEEFLRKTKNQLLYGIQKDLHEDLNKAQFIRQSKDFYATRGTDESFKILFKALFAENADLIRPIDHVISPSNANFKKTRDIIVESVEGDPLDLVNKTLFQDEFENISKAYAPVSHVESINVGINTNIFYKVSLDTSWNQNDGSTELLYGEFSAHAKSIIVGDVGIAQTYIDVDSTLGFPNSGTLSYTYSNGTSGIATYAYKTLNQFLGINTTSIASTIRDMAMVDQDTYAYSAGTASTDRLSLFISASSPTGRIKFSERISNTSTDLLASTKLHRDPSGWYHIVLRWDTTNTTEDDRVRLYVNGEQLTDFDTRNNPGLNHESFIGNNIEHTIGYNQDSTYLNSSQAQCYFVDGQSLGPEEFGFTDLRTGSWRPKKFNGSVTTAAVAGTTLAAADNGKPFYNTTDST